MISRRSWERMQKNNARLRLAFENQLEKTRACAQEADALSTQPSNLGEQLVILDAAKRDADDSLLRTLHGRLTPYSISVK
jgi:hypothetical protein